MKFKKISALLSVFLLFSCLSIPASAAAPSAQFASIAVGEELTGNDGSSYGAAYIDSNSRTMVPLRALATLLGLEVTWDQATTTASFSDGKTTVSFHQNQQSFLKNGVSSSMDTAAVNNSGRIYAPARYLAEAFGYSVGWNNSSRTVIIHKNSANSVVTRKSGVVKASDITLKSYQFSTRYYHYDVIVFTNNSNAPCNLTVTSNYFDDSGSIVDTESDSITVLSPHTSTAIYNMPDVQYSSVSYAVTIEESKYYVSTTQDLTASYNIVESDTFFGGTNIVGTVKNNGENAAQFVKVTALLFKNDEIVDIETTYAASELEPGAEASFKCSSYTDFDSIELYLDSQSSIRF